MRRSAGWECYFLIPFVVCVLGHSDVFALTASIGPNGCNAQAVHALGFTGQGVGVGVLSQAHCRVSHEAFFDKDGLGNPTGSSHAHWFDATGDTVSPSPYEPFWHDTAMAGIVGSRGGKNYPAEIGVAPDAEIYSIKITRPVSATDPNRVISIQWIEAGLDELVSRQCRIAVTGIQFPISSLTPNGNSQYSLVYDYYANTDDMIFINAAGNDASSITVFGDGYNGITTAGLITTETDVYRQVGTASNPGPTVDNRRKPEIAAPAQNLWLPISWSDTYWASQGTTRGETSWAGPHAAGVAALLVQYANSSEEIDDGHSEVIKAAMVNTTFPNIRSRTGVETTGQLWHSQRGYGRVDALRAYNVLSQPKVATEPNIIQSAGWAYQSIGSYQQHTYRINGYKNERLTLTLTWHRAVQKSGSTYYDEMTPKLNLDLSIYDPNGNAVFSEIYDPSHPNNLRKADVLLPMDGFYEVRVANTTNKTGRYYGLAFELLEPLEGDFNTDYVVDTSDLTMMALYWLADDCTGTEQACYWLDLNTDGKIDLADMAILSADWLTTDPRYYTTP
jgi:hypothetical protein